MKAKIILSLSILIPFAMVFTYVWRTATDYFYGDDTILIKGGFIENYLNGALTFVDIWRPKGMIRFLGYNLLLLANTKWFSMNPKIFFFMIPFLLLVSALLIYRGYQKSLAPERSPEFIATTFFALTLIIFNVIQWQGLISGYSLNFQLPMPFIIASFVSLELYLTKGKRYLPLAFILTALAVLVFGGTPVFAFAPALVLTFLCYILTRHLILTKDFWVRASILSVFLTAMAFIYMFGIHQNDSAPTFSPYHSPFVTEILTHPWETAQFLLASFCASIIGIDAFFACNYFSLHSITIIGLIVVVLYAFALVLFFRSHMYERTYLPFFLIMQTTSHLAIVTIGRFGLVGRSGAMMSSYTCVSIFGLVAMVWIFIFVLAHHGKLSVFLKSIIYAGIAFVFAGLLLTSIVVWSVQPDRKAYFEQLHRTAMQIDTATPEELERFDFNKQICDSLRLLRQYKLNIYREEP
jgi:hypothetical protein